MFSTAVKFQLTTVKEVLLFAQLIKLNKFITFSICFMLS